MNNQFDASPFAAGFSSAVVERLAQAQAILSLSTRFDSDAATDGPRLAAQRVALRMVNTTVSQLVFGSGVDALGPDVVAQVSDSLTSAQGVISLLANCEPDSETDDELELASNAAIGFLRDAMNTLEQVAP
jgi:hypothetical protein